jgi:hypothetical protein
VSSGWGFSPLSLCSSPSALRAHFWTVSPTDFADIISQHRQTIIQRIQSAQSILGDIIFVWLSKDVQHMSIALFRASHIHVDIK